MNQVYITGSKKVDRVGLLHIPKTGGTTIASSPLIQEFGHAMAYTTEESKYNYLYMYQDPEHAKKVALSMEHLQTWYVICAVRNTFDWLISYADWCSCFNNWNPGHYDSPIAKKGFEYFIRHIMNRDDRWPCRKFIHCQLFTPTGELVPDHIFHTEQLDEELRLFFGSKGQKWIPQPRKQIGRAKLVNRRPPAEQLYKDDKLVAEIYDCWGEEMKLFGYGKDPFDNKHYPLQATLDGPIDDKSIVRYTWNDNQLMRPMK